MSATSHSFTGDELAWVAADTALRAKAAGLAAELGRDAEDIYKTLRHLANMISGYARPEAPGAAWAYNDYSIMLYQKTAETA